VQDEPLFCHRVAGLDIAKAGVEVTIRVPSDTMGYEVYTGNSL
jgi:hypothetical protein